MSTPETCPCCGRPMPTAASADTVPAPARLEPPAPIAEVVVEVRIDRFLEITIESEDARSIIQREAERFGECEWRALQHELTVFIRPTYRPRIHEIAAYLQSLVGQEV